MVSIRIGADGWRPLAQIEDYESWINQQINRRRPNGERVCVQVRVDRDPIHVLLSTPNCDSGVGGRPPRPDEQRIIDLWERRGLLNENYTGGQVVAFLKHLRDLL